MCIHNASIQIELFEFSYINTFRVHILQFTIVRQATATKTMAIVVIDLTLLMRFYVLSLVCIPIDRKLSRIVILHPECRIQLVLYKYTNAIQSARPNTEKSNKSMTTLSFSKQKQLNIFSDVVIKKIDTYISNGLVCARGECECWMFYKTFNFKLANRILFFFLSFLLHCFMVWPFVVDQLSLLLMRISVWCCVLCVMCNSNKWLLNNYEQSHMDFRLVKT